MRPTVALVVGGVAGVLLSGLLAAIAVVFVPAGWRGERFVWTIAATIVALSVWATWRMAGSRRA